jgi:hypothetical protein
MNIKTITALIPESFEYTDPRTGVTETIELQLKRMSFGMMPSKELRQALDDEDTTAMAELLSGLIDSWDIDADGEPFPPTAENLKLAPADFTAALVECVLEKVLLPNPQKAGASPNGSEPAVTSTAALTIASESDTISASPVGSGD